MLFEEIKKIISNLYPNENFKLSLNKKSKFGHLSLNLAFLVSEKTKSPLFTLAQRISREIVRKAPDNLFEKVEAHPSGFINIWLSKATIYREFTKLFYNREGYIFPPVGKGKIVIIEYSQPNIAKRMHLGHLRTTIFGDALANIHQSLGFKVVRWNYLGDWGTQFGNILVAYKLWGKKDRLNRLKGNLLDYLQELYVRFHIESLRNRELEKLGREEFLKLEKGDKTNMRLWRWFRLESIKEFQKIYKILGVKFNTFKGEYSFRKQAKYIIAELNSRGLIQESEGALIVSLDKFGLPPALIQKKDGATLYLTRDIAALKYRLEKYRPAKLLYVVSNEQTLHFAQLFKIMELLGWGRGVEVAHLKYGLVLGEKGQKFSTRRGETVLVREVLDRAEDLAFRIVESKNPHLSLKQKSKIAQAVGIGAIKYAILKEHRNTDITFNWSQMLDFKGNNSPYLQYTYARLCSILRKKRKLSEAISDIKFNHLRDSKEIDLMLKSIFLSEILKESSEEYLTNNLTNYLYELANLSNRFYESLPVLREKDKDLQKERLALVAVVRFILKEGLLLLGIKTPSVI